MRLINALLFGVSSVALMSLTGLASMSTTATAATHPRKLQAITQNQLKPARPAPSTGSRYGQPQQPAVKPPPPPPCDPKVDPFCPTIVPPALECDLTPSSDLDSTHGTVILGTDIQNGPRTDCGSNGYASTGDVVEYWCYTGTYPNSWSYGEDTTAGGRTGWIKDSNLSKNKYGGRGSIQKCTF